MINFMIKIFFVILFGISGYLAYYKGYLNKLLYRNTAGLSEQIKTIRPVRKDIVKKKVSKVIPFDICPVCFIPAVKQIDASFIKLFISKFLMEFLLPFKN